jgi:uncharacterized protein YjcR
MAQEHLKKNKSRGEKHYMSRLTEALVLQMRAEYEAGVKQKDLALKYGIQHNTVSEIVRRKSWKHI